MELKVFTNNEINEAHGYLLIKENKAILIDTGCSSEDITKYCLDNSIQITDVFLTHSHFDHLLGLNEIAKSFEGLKIHIGKHDFKNMFSAKKNFSRSKSVWYEVEKELNLIPIKNKYEIISTVVWDVECLLMGGHTKGTTLFFVDDNIFVGDTMFINTVGFHDKKMPGCNVKKFNQSLIWLVNNTFGLKIYPGHKQFGFKIEDILNNKDHQMYKEKIIKTE